MYISELDFEYIDNYSKFLQESINSLVYHTYSYKDFICNILNAKSRYLLILDEREVIASLPLIYKESDLGIVYNSLPFFGSIGDLVLKKGYQSKLADIFLLLKKYLLDILIDKNIISLVLITNPFSGFSISDVIRNLFDEYDYISNNYLVFGDKRLLYLTLFNFENDFNNGIFEIIRDTTKRNIKKSLKLGVRVEIRNDMLDFLKLVHYENMEKIGGKKKPESFFYKMGDYFSKGKDYNLFVSFLGKEPVAALLVFYHRDIVEYFIPVIKEEYRSTQALSLAIFFAMEDSFYKGYKVWNWGGTNLEQHSLINFKKKWSNKLLLYDYIILFNKSKKEFILKSLNNIKEKFDYFYVFPFKYLDSIVYESE